MWVSAANAYRSTQWEELQKSSRMNEPARAQENRLGNRELHTRTVAAVGCGDRLKERHPLVPEVAHTEQYARSLEERRRLERLHKRRLAHCVQRPSSGWLRLLLTKSMFLGGASHHQEADSEVREASITTTVDHL